MRSRIWSVLLLVSSAACAPSAPHVAPAPRRHAADVPPILSLLSERERLSLTSPQVIALDSVAREWDVANDRLTRRFRPGRGIVPIAALRAEASPTRAAVAENNRRAAAAVERILTPAQRQAACTTRQAPDTGRRVWPWCGSSPAAQSLAAQQGASAR